jgi:diaminopimelate decarboxylase
MTTPVFLSSEQVREVRENFGSPVYVYDANTLTQRAQEMLAFPNAYGLTVRYAMKALPNAAVLRLFAELGLNIDASSGFEADRAMLAGIAPEKIQITAQEIPRNLEELVRKGVLYNACSLHQIENYGKLFPGSDLCVRINPGLGSGHSNRTNVGGPSSSFGIWHEHLDEVFALAEKHNLTITGMHTHIGSGSDPDTWVHCARMSLEIAAKMPDVTRLSLGGGYKVARMDDEVSADIQVIGSQIVPEFERFAAENGRELHLEVEPGTYLVANAGAVVCSIMDIVDTGSEGHTFLKTDSGMTDVLRPSMYGAQHPICLIPQTDEARGTATYLITGHCCESGDVLTPAPGDPEGLLPRELTEAKIGDLLVVDGSGAYCASMASKNYNSFPESAEVMLDTDDTFRLIRQRQTLEQILVNEV